MRLIVTEKNNSAKKIAEILGGGNAKAEASYKVPFYTWSDSDGGDQVAIGLKGHVLNPAFPESYKNWQETDPKTLIDAELIKEATDKNVLRAVKKAAKDATSVVIATDFDREGELIGLEALEEILDVNPGVEGSVKRARYSALTKEEIERAFNELDDLSYDLAHAGWARQDIDLIWGATLTRAVSLATRRFGSNFLSVGRVQSPTLGLIVERELERRAHVAEPYWEVFAKFVHPEGSFEAHHKTDKFWSEPEADAALAGTAAPGHRPRALEAQEHAQAADAVQHDRLRDRSLEPARDHTVAGDAGRRGPLHGRLHLLPAHRQHRLSGVAAAAGARHLAGPDPRVQRRGTAARRSADADTRQEGDDRPPADLSDPGRLSRTRSSAATTPIAASTSWSCAASSRPSTHR